MIETERLILRPYALGDYAAYSSMTVDPAVYRFLSGEPMAHEEAWNRLLRYTGHWTLLGYGMFAVFDKADGRYLGETGLADFRRGLGPSFDEDDEAAWVFTAAAHGRGIASEAAGAAHDWYRATRGRARTVCIIHPDNAGSIGVSRKLGYTPFGETTYRGQPVRMFERTA